MLPDLDWSRQLIVLRSMTKRTRVLHDAQVLQLKMWPFAIDPGLQAAGSVARVDFVGHVVHYEWTDADKPVGWQPAADYQQRLQALEDSVKFLLGANWSLTVKMNSSPIFPLNEPTRRNSGRNRRRARRGAKKSRR